MRKRQLISFKTAHPVVQRSLFLTNFYSTWKSVKANPLLGFSLDLDLINPQGPKRWLWLLVWGPRDPREILLLPSQSRGLPWWLSGKEPARQCRRRKRYRLNWTELNWIRAEGFPDGSAVKNLPANAGDARGTDSIPGLKSSHGEGNGNPL